MSLKIFKVTGTTVDGRTRIIDVAAVGRGQATRLAIQHFGTFEVRKVELKQELDDGRAS